MRHEVQEGAGDVEHIEAQWRAKASGERGEGDAIRSKKWYNTREGARNAE